MCRDFENSLLYFRCFTFLIILPLKEKPVSAEEEKCEIVPDYAGRLKGDCYQKEVTIVPQDFDNKIKVLDISFTNISKLDKDDLKNYPLLERLVMRKVNVTSFPGGFFHHTPVLNMVNISETQITNLNEIPTSVIVLNFTFCEFHGVNFSHLVKLKQLFMKDSTDLKKVPALAEKAPLETIDLRACDLREAHYSQVAPFCQLKYFGLNSTELLKPEHLHKCCEFRKWGTKWNISGFIAQNCSYSEEYPSCYSLGIILDDKEVQKYQNCLYEVQFGQFLIMLIVLIIIVIFVIGAGVAFFIYHHYHYYLPKLPAQDRESYTEVEIEALDEADSKLD